MRILTFILMFACQLSFAATYSRQHAATIVDGKRILASDLNDEFDAIQSAVNNIDSSQISDGTLQTTDFAASSSAAFTSRKRGCHISRASNSQGAKVINVAPPCEILIGGVRGTISATASVSIIDALDTGLPDPGEPANATGSILYLYGDPADDATIAFEVSLTSPELKTFAKQGDSTKRYIGSVLTQERSFGKVDPNLSNATDDIYNFVQIGNKIILIDDNQANRQSFLLDPQDVVTASRADITFSKVPAMARAVILKYTLGIDDQDGSEVAGCGAEMGDSQEFQFASFVTDMSMGSIPEPVPVRDATGDNKVFVANVLVDNHLNCRNITFGVKGWVEPSELHE